MELTSADAGELRKLVEHWFVHPETELEATFGVKGQVDSQTFLEVANRLRAKGYSGVPQEDRLNVCLPDHVRFTLTQIGVIEQYCRDNRMNGKPFVALIKDRTSGTQSNVDLKEYDVRVKARNEIPMAKDDPRVVDLLGKWPAIRKAFRLIRRWTFMGEGIKFDLSMVRSTPRDVRGEFKWVRTFQDFNHKGAQPVYEIEVELEKDKFASADDALKALLKGIGEILRGIQKHFLLLRKSVAERVLQEYKELTGTDRFRGVAPITLVKQNMISEVDEKIPNLRDGYNVTDKADGLRCMGFCTKEGEFFLIDIGMKVYRTGLKCGECKSSLVDGEWVTRDKAGKPVQLFLLFDAYIAPDKQIVSKQPFQGPDGRYVRLQEWVRLWKAGAQKLLTTANLSVAMKTFFFGTKGTVDIFQRADQMLKQDQIYSTDGLIFTPNALGLPDKPGVGFKQQFKWKPAIDNTIDFLVTFEKDPELKTQDKVTVGEHPEKGLVRYKTMRLFVGSDRDPAFDNPRDTVLNVAALPSGEGVRDVRERRGQYKPVLFNPADFPDTMASVCYLEVTRDEDTGEEYVQTEHSNEPIRDRSIVEIRYEPSNPPGWRWIPNRVRSDKTDRFLRGELTKTLNSDMNAQGVWNSIHDPVTKSMITTGNDEPTDEEMQDLVRPEAEALERKYFERKASKADLLVVGGLRDYHNRWIKERILYKAAFQEAPGKRLLDVAVGKAADLQRWRRNNVGFALGVDYAGENIRDPSDGAYRRYLNTVIENGRDRVAPMAFVIGDSSKSLVSGEAGATPEEQDILRAVFGKFPTQGTVPKFIETDCAGKLRQGADVVSCMFALHYFFKDEATFNGLLQNISDTLKEGGYFICCQFDGERVFELLRGVPKGQSKTGEDAKNILWTITKGYDAEEIPAGSEAFGMPIDVNFITIGLPQREYLVPLQLLVDKMATIGLELLTDAEAKALGLQKSTNTFEESYEMARKANNKFNMIDAVKRFSFLNRWFIFKRKSGGVMAKAKEEAGVEVEENGEGEEVVDGVAGEVAKPTADESEPRTVLGRALNEEVKAGPERTVPVPNATAVPAQQIAAQKLTFKPSELFQFSVDAELKDKLKIGDKGAGRWLAPSAPFPIVDPFEASVIYPSVEHFLAGMRFRLASDKPMVAKTVFSREGSIHQKYIKTRETERVAGAFSEERDFELLKEESDAVKRAQQAAALREYGAKIDETKWVTHKQDMLREAVRQRVERDARLRKIVDAVRKEGKYLLFHVKGLGNELGGQRRADDRIEGENRYGKMLMEVAGGF